MAFIAAAMSFVAEGVRSVRVSNGASRLCRSSIVFLELDFFIVSFVLVDVLLVRSNTLFLLRLFCRARRTTGSSNSIRLSVISISFGLFLLANDLVVHSDLAIAQPRDEFNSYRLSLCF